MTSGRILSLSRPPLAPLIWDSQTSNIPSSPKSKEQFKEVVSDLWSASERERERERERASRVKVGMAEGKDSSLVLSRPYYT